MRRGAAGGQSWTTFITYDPTRRSPWAGIMQVVERDGVVYVAAQNAEAWTAGALDIPEHVPGTFSDSRRVGTLRPYARYDHVRIAPDTPLIGGSDQQVGPTVGVRYDPTHSVAVKAQVERWSIQPSLVDRRARVQVCFAF